MFIRPCYRTKDGKRHAYWALVESYRGKRGPRQRTVAYLGQLDQQERLGIRQAAQGDPQSYQRHLFDDVEPQWVEVDLKRVRVERCLEFGGPWLAVQLLEQLGLSSVLKGLLPEGRQEIPWAVMGMRCLSYVAAKPAGRRRRLFTSGLRSGLKKDS